MPGLTVATHNAMLDALDAYGWVSLHSADPGATGANELAGGVPAYGRRAANWSPAAAGEKPFNPAAHNVPAGSTVAFVGYWTAQNGGTFGGSRAVPQPEVFAGPGEYDATGAETLADAGA